MKTLKSRIGAAKKTEAMLQRKVDSLLEDLASLKKEAKTLRERAERAEHDPEIAKARLALEREQRREAAIAIQRIIRGRRGRARAASMEEQQEEGGKGEDVRLHEREREKERDREREGEAFL